MNLADLGHILSGGGIGLFVLLTLVEIAPIKVNPWSKILKFIGRAFNADVLNELKAVKAQQQELQNDFADMRRSQILRFNNELIRKTPKHTKEEFVEILHIIDVYEKYCANHPDYSNTRAIHAIANIQRAYDKCMVDGDFL